MDLNERNMDKGRTVANASMACVIIGSIGTVASLFYMFICTGGRWFSPEHIGNEELLFADWLSTAKISSLAGIACLIVIFGIAFGIYGMHKFDKSLHSYKLARTAVIVGTVGLVTGYIISSVYSFVAFYDFTTSLFNNINRH